MFSSLLTHTVTVSRATATTGAKKTYQQVSTDLVCGIQPLNDVAAQQAGLAYGKGYMGYFDVDADVKEGDQLVDQTGRKFYVKGYKLRDYGNHPHISAMLIQDSAR